eukprot:m.214806 g.214806  ORF g.214806 m.214806 type:complete len:622 (+) comp39819_c0_seq32:51-1916(+)
MATRSDWKKYVQPNWANVHLGFAFSNQLRAELMNCGLLSYEDIEEIATKATDYERKEALVWKFLPTRGPGSLNKFCEALKNVNAHAGVIIEKAMAKGSNAMGREEERSTSSEVMEQSSAPIAAASPPAPLDQADVCIVMAMDIEREQTKQVLEYVADKKTEQMSIVDDSGKVKRECRAVDWTFMGKGPLTLRKGPLTLRVALFQQAKMGSSEASQLVNDIAQLKPALIAMVGVCAGAENKVKAGDLLAPLELQIVSGKVRENGEMDRQPTIAQLRSEMKKLVSGAAANMDPYAWKECLPDKRLLIAPCDFQDKILWYLRNKDEGITAKEIMNLEGFGDVEAEWVEEAVEKLLDAGQLTKEGRKKKQDVVKVSEKGRIYIVENIDEEELEATRNPQVLTGPVLTIDVVSENLKFSDLRKVAANRKLVGAEMEGYSFLFSADSNMQYKNAVFIKVVSDYGSKRSKMDYYQPYCASSAAAFLCYFIKRNPQLFPDLAHGPGGGGNGTSDGAMHPAGTFPKYHEVMALIGDTPKVEDFKRLKLSVAKIGSTFWEGIGTELLDERQVADIKGSVNSVKLNNIIANWITGSKEPATVKKLLLVCDNNGVGNPEIKAEFNRRKTELDD